MSDRTFQSVIDGLNAMIVNKQTIEPSLWLDAAQFINIFLEDEQNKLFVLEQKIAYVKSELILTGRPVSEAKVRVEAMDDYVEMRRQKAKIERAIELIRLAKLQSRTSVDILRSN